MDNSNNRFLEEYKHLDKLLRDMYRSEKGVTSYIDDMKKIPEYESRGIPGWNADLQRLIMLRKLRNYLVHECGTLDREMCRESDIAWIIGFTRRIFQRTDPIAIYADRSKAARQGNSDEKQSYMNRSEKGTEEYGSEFECFVGKILVGMMIVATCVIVGWFMSKILR